MKSSRICSLLMLIAVILSCQSDHFEMENLLSDETVESKFDSKKDPYKNYILPREFSDPYFSEERDNMSEEEWNVLVDTITKWVNDKTNTLENQCKKAASCEDKMKLMDLLFFMQKQIDILELGTVITIASLCDGFLDESNTLVSIIPEDISLEVNESIDLEYQIKVGNETCSGNVEWSSRDPGIATVDQNGHVTAIAPGVTYIYARVKEANHIDGLVRVEVTEPEDSKYEIVFIVDASPEGIWGVFDPGGIKDSSARIYNALLSNFGNDFKFGLVGFDHHRVMPFGNTMEVCITDGWPETYADWKPLIEQAPFVKWLDFTNNQEDIINAIDDIRLMCSVCNAPQCMSSAPYTAIIETINNFNWSEGSKKAIIIYGSKPATYYTGSSNESNSNGIEGVSGLTASNAIDLAIDNEIKIFTISGKYSNTYFGQWLNQEFQIIANGTHGHFEMGAYSGSISSNAVISMISRIKSSY